MTIRSCLWACAAAMAATIPQFAQAEPPGPIPVVDAASPYAGVLPPYEVLTIVRSSGFSPIGRPVLVGATYQIAAIDPYDMNVRLLVDGRSGQILAVRDFAGPSYGPGPAYYPPGDARALMPRPVGGPPFWGSRYEERPTPPRTIPVAPASRQAAVTPQTPVPRARPLAPAGEKRSAQAPQAPAAVTGAVEPAKPQAPAESPASTSAPAGDGAKDIVLPPVQPLD